jgi:hypothetical protein
MSSATSAIGVESADGKAEVEHLDRFVEVAFAFDELTVSYPDESEIGRAMSPVARGA